MAFLAYDPNLDPNKKDPSDPQSISGESTSFNNEPPGSNTSSARPQKSSGQYTNIQSYLGSNTEQAAQMGNQITQKVEDKSVQAQSDISKLAAEKTNTAAVDPNKYLADPVRTTAQDRQEYAKLRTTGGYEGPADISGTQNYKTAYGSASEADNLVKATGTEEGRMTLLQDQYRRPNYSRGLQSLDQVLLQNDPTSKQKFADINQKYSGIASLFDSTAAEVGNSINQSKRIALSNKNAILNAEAKAWEDLINPIQSRATQANKENPALVQRITDDARDEILNDETLAMLGLNEGQDIYDLSLGNYLSPNLTQVGLDNVASAEERAKYLALQSLINDPTRTQITADGKQVNPISFNKEQFEKDYAGKKSAAEEAMKKVVIDVTPTYSGRFTYQNPFNSNQLTYDQYKQVADKAEALFSKFGSDYRWDDATGPEYQRLQNELVQAAVSAGIANDNVFGDAPETAFIRAMEQARNQYNTTNKNFGIGRRIKKG